MEYFLIHLKIEVKNICPICKSENVIKWTKRQTENRGIIQRYKCKPCNKTFTLDDGFFRMRNAPQKVTCAITYFTEEFLQEKFRNISKHFILIIQTTLLF